MKPFVFSADSHIMEPADIFLEGLPASLKDHAIHARMDGEYLVTGTKDKIIYRLRVGQHREKQLGDAQRRGIREIDGRPEEIGHLIAFMVSGKSDFVTGQVIGFTGGWP